MREVARRRLRSDEWLARRAGRGDSRAFAALYERHHRSLYRYCRSIVGDPDDAADALQSAMARALEAISTRDERAPVRAWLFRIAHNESISLIRARRGADALEPEALIGPDMEADAELRRRLEQLVTDLQALPDRQRGALLMREVSGLGHAEIADALEVSEGTVKQTIYEARMALHDFAAGREMACAAVRRQLSDGDGRTARSRRLRAHLRSCPGCRAFRRELRARRSELQAIAPVVPGVTAAAVLESVAGGSAGGGGALAGLIGGSGVAKTVAVGTATVTAGAGVATFTVVVPEGRAPDRAPPVVEAAPAEPPRGATEVASSAEGREDEGERPRPSPTAAPPDRAAVDRTVSRPKAGGGAESRPAGEPPAAVEKLPAEAEEGAGRQPAAATPEPTATREPTATPEPPDDADELASEEDDDPAETPEADPAETLEGVPVETPGGEPAELDDEEPDDD